MLGKYNQDKKNNSNTTDESDYKRIIEEIRSVLDKPTTKEVKSDSDIERDKHLKDNISKRDDDVTRLLNRFVSEHDNRIKNDKKLKKRFLIGLTIGLVFIGLIIAAAIVCVFVFPLQIGNLITLLGIVFSFLGSTLFIVKMLLNYLFPLDSDKNIISLISSIINHDLNQYRNLRNISDENKNQNNKKDE